MVGKTLKLSLYVIVRNKQYFKVACSYREHHFILVICVYDVSGSARDLICTHFADGMTELTIAYILLGMLKALEYIHHMGYVHR